MILAPLALALAAGGILMSTPLFAGEQEGTSSTSYWYGGELNPLVITRDGVNYRLIGKCVVEALTGDQVTRSYAHVDRLGSLRMVIDDHGKVVQSLGYDDYGLTRIESQSTAATDDSMASFYRFQGQEQEIFSLAKLGIDNDALASWLDEIQLYHFPWRDYAAGLTAFTETDPIPSQDSLYAALAANPVNFTDPTGGMEESKYADDENENEQAQLNDLLDQFAHNSEIGFTPAERQLLEKAYLKGRNVIVAEIERHNALHIELTNLLRDTYFAADAADDHEEWKTLMVDLYYFEKWHDEVSDRLEMAEEELEKFEQKNAILRQAWTWSVFVNAFSTNDEALENDEIKTDLLQPMNVSLSPAPAAEAPAVPAREGSLVLRSQAEEDEEKAELEVKVQNDEKSHEPHSDMQE